MGGGEQPVVVRVRRVVGLLSGLWLLVGFGLGAAWLGVSVTAGAASTTLFSSPTPGFTASAATLPAGICFVTISADGGHRGPRGHAGHAGGPATNLSPPG